MLIALAAVIVAVPLWRALERRAVLKAHRIDPADVARGYVTLWRNPDGILVPVPGHRSPLAR